VSRTTILAVYRYCFRPRIEEIDELKNSWQSAPLVWEKIAQTYGDGFHWMHGAGESEGKLWMLYDDPRLKPFERAVFALTFDRWYVEKKDFAQAAEDIQAFMDRHSISGHWAHIRNLFQSDPDYPAIGFYWTSVADNPFNGCWNDAKEDYDPLDWSTTYSVYDELKEPA
jgi:hypothetical protein